MVAAAIPPPSEGEPIAVGDDGKLRVSDNPIIPWIEGDGIGADLRVAAHTVFDGAIEHSDFGRAIVANMEG